MCDFVPAFDAVRGPLIDVILMGLDDCGLMCDFVHAFGFVRLTLCAAPLHAIDVIVIDNVAVVSAFGFARADLW